MDQTHFGSLLTQSSAVMRSIVRFYAGESYEECLRGLVEGIGVQNAQDAQPGRFGAGDRKCKKRASNRECLNPLARIPGLEDEGLPCAPCSQKRNALWALIPVRW